jgi:glycolate oxidase FAD binding subunit
MCVAAETQTVRDSASIQPIWRGLRELADPSIAGIALLKAAVPPARSAAVLGALRRAATDLGFSPALQARAGTGIVYLRLAPATWDADTLSALITLVGHGRDYARGESGSLVVEACPTEAKHDLDIWGDPGNAFSVMQALKNNLDPKGTLNPGRFVGRL